MEPVVVVIIIAAFVGFALLNQATESARTRDVTRRVDRRIDHVTEGLERRKAFLEREIHVLQQEESEWRELVELAKGELQALRTLVREELARSGRRAFWQGFAVNVLVAIASSAFGWWVAQ